MRALLLALLLAPTALTPAQASSDMSQPGTGPGTLVAASTLTISGAGTACFTAGAFSINCAAGSVTGSSATFNDLRLTYGLTAATASISGSVTASSVTSQSGFSMLAGQALFGATAAQAGSDIRIIAARNVSGNHTLIRADAAAASQSAFEWSKDGTLKWTAVVAGSSNDLGFYDGSGYAFVLSPVSGGGSSFTSGVTASSVTSQGNLAMNLNGASIGWNDGAGNIRQMLSFGSVFEINGGNAFNTRIGNGGGNTSIGVTTAFPTTLNVEGTAQFGSGAAKSTFTASGFWEPYSRTKAQIDLLVPTKVGQVIYASDTTLPGLCVSTGTAAAQWRKMESATLGCGTNN